MNYTTKVTKKLCINYNHSVNRIHNLSTKSRTSSVFKDYQLSSAKLKTNFRGLKLIPPGYYIHVTPGCRIFELNKADDGNYLTLKLLTSMEHKLNSFTENAVANYIFFHSFSRYGTFSKGFDAKEYREDPKKCILSAQCLAKAVLKFPKPILSSYCGYLNGTAFSGNTFLLFHCYSCIPLYQLFILVTCE